jgi:hypothetical protein
VGEVARDVIRDATVILERDPSTGEEFGRRLTSPSGPGERRSIAERSRVADETASTTRPGRRPLSDDFLREVVTEWTNAKERGAAASYELAQLYGVEPSTVRQWMFKARARGLAGKETDG